MHNQFKYFTALPGFWNVYICKVDRRNSQIRICTNQRVLEHIVVKKYIFKNEMKFTKWMGLNSCAACVLMIWSELQIVLTHKKIHIILSKTCSKHWKHDICTWLCHDCSNIQFESTQHLSWSEKMPLKYLYSKENVWRKKKEGVENK